MNTAIQVILLHVKHLVFNTFIKCQHLCFKQEDQSVRMNEQRTDNGIKQVLQLE